MRYLVVMLLSLAAGAVVYVVSMRTGQDETYAIGFEPELPMLDEPPGATADPPPGYTYLQVAVTNGPSIRERLQGLLGSLALVVVAMMAVAGALYAIGVVISRVIRAFVGEDGSGASLP
jgi:hypothetical protein